MIIILLRTVILYLVLLLVIRIMGKSELSKMSPFQLVIIFMIAELAAIPITSPSIPIMNGVVAIFSLLVLEVLLSFLSIKSEWFKNFISGKPSVLIENGEINHAELKKLRITLNDLLAQLRLGHAPSIADVDSAVLEANGELSIIVTPDKRPLTPGDMSIMKPKESMPRIVISDGVLYANSLARLNIPVEEFQTALLKYGITDYKHVYLAMYDEKKELHVYTLNRKTMKASGVSS